MTGRALPLVLPKGARKALVAALVAGAAFTGFMGFLHTAPGRPLRGLLLGSRCPIGMDRPASQETIDRSRVKALATERGTEKAPARVALGFELGAATRATVEAWAEKSGSACAPLARQNGLRCEKVAPASLPGGPRGDDLPIQSLEFMLDRFDKLVAIVAVHGKRAPDVAAAWYGRHAKALESDFGVRPAGPLEVESSALARKLHSATAQQRFLDLRALVTTTNLGDEALCTEQYNLIEDAI